MPSLFTSVMALVIAMIGYMIWDRKTAQQPFHLILDIFLVMLISDINMKSNIVITNEV